MGTSQVGQACANAVIAEHKIYYLLDFAMVRWQIYRIRFTMNGKDYYYVGKTKNYQRRMEQHLDKFDNQQGALWIQKTFPPDVLDSAVTEQIGGEIDDAIKSSHEETRKTLNLMVQHGVRYVRGKKFKLIYDDYYVHYFCDESNFSFLYLFSYFKRC